MAKVSPEQVFGVGYYWYNWLRKSHPELMEELKDMAPEFTPEDFELPSEQPLNPPEGDKMPKEWWLRWGRGLMENVYPVMQVIMKPEYLKFWLEGLRERMAAHGITMEEVFEEL